MENVISNGNTKYVQQAISYKKNKLFSAALKFESRMPKTIHYTVNVISLRNNYSYQYALSGLIWLCIGFTTKGIEHSGVFNNLVI